MSTSLKNKVQNIWKAEHERTLKIKKNIVYSFLIKGLSVLTGYLLFPIAMNYVNPVQYGIWLTVASVVAWINTFDIGLSNGLRNKLANDIALNKNENFAKYVSTTYALLFLISLLIFGCFFILGAFFNWNHLLDIPGSIGLNLGPIVLTALGCVCFQFILQPVNSILTASQEPFKSSLIFLSGQFLALILTCFLTKYTYGTLFLLVIVVSGAPVLVLFTSSVYLFKTSLNTFAPRFKFIDLKSAKNLLTTGGAFFFVQIGALILYETDNIIITRTLGPQEVTVFNIAFKYFSIITIGFSIFLTPYWSAFTDAYTKKDFVWIKQSVRKIRLLWICFSAFAVLLFFFSPIFYRLWIGDKIVVPPLLSFIIGVNVIVQTWTIIHSYFLNGVGKLRIQLILVIGTGFLNIPLSVWLINRIGVSGTVLANVIVMTIIGAFLTYQYRLIINKKATGIWNY